MQLDTKNLGTPEEWLKRAKSNLVIPRQPTFTMNGLKQEREQWLKDMDVESIVAEIKQRRKKV